MDRTNGTILGELAVSGIAEYSDRREVVVTDRQGLKVGDHFVNLNRCGRNFSIEECHLGPLRGNGLLLQSWNGTVRYNHIEHTAQNGITMTWGVGDNEGPFPRYLDINRNLIHHCGAFPKPITRSPKKTSRI